MEPKELPTTQELAALIAARTPEARSEARLRAAIELGRELSARGDALIEHFVADARAAGVAWTEIGALFGTSKQAAQKRYGATIGGRGARPGRWTPTHDVLNRAGEQARELGHNYVGSEHVLLGLLEARDGLAAHVLAELGITSDVVLAELARLTGRCEPGPYDCLPLAPRLKQALEAAPRIAAGLGHQVADTEHLLAGIVSVPDALAVEILDRQGVSADDARAALARRLQIDAAQLLVPRARRRRLLARTR